MAENSGKPLPNLTKDEEAERWLETADLSEYDLSGMKPFSSEFRMKDARVNMRMPHWLVTQLDTRKNRVDEPGDAVIWG